MSLEELEEIKKTIIKGLVSDDDLMETLVLKGGNALSLIYRVNNRGSYDIDFSMEKDFNEELEIVMDKIKSNLSKSFLELEYVLFDFKYSEQPHTLSADVKSFWGGYNINFKLIRKANYYEDDIELMRRTAVRVAPNISPKFEIDISKYEYVENRIVTDVDGYTVYVYAPEMIVFEKARAICQQNDEYCAIIHSKEKQKSRAKDFYDIYTILEYYQVGDLYSEENIKLIKSIFDAKRVPLNYIDLVSNYEEKHKLGYQSLVDTLPATEEIKDFNFYFDYFMKKFLPFAQL